MQNLIQPELVDSLRTVVDKEGLDAEKLVVTLPTELVPGSLNRRMVFIADGTKAAIWTVPNLRELFRGQRVPPKLEEYPPEYVPCFALVEQHVLILSEMIGDRTDQEIEEVYSLLRRRPDGKSLGREHDYFWQVSALLLGKYALSEREFTEMFGALGRSTRTWGQSPVSRNYVAFLRTTFSREE